MTVRVTSVEMVSLLLQYGQAYTAAVLLLQPLVMGVSALWAFSFGGGPNIYGCTLTDPWQSLDHDFESLLHVAVVAGELEVVECLLKEDAKINLRDSMGWTPLARATKIRDTKMVKLLLSYRDQNGKIVTGSEQGEKPPPVCHTIPLRFSKFAEPALSESSEDEWGFEDEWGLRDDSWRRGRKIYECKRSTREVEGIPPSLPVAVHHQSRTR